LPRKQQVSLAMNKCYLPFHPISLNEPNHYLFSDLTNLALFPGFPHFGCLFLVYYTERQPKNKNGRGLVMRLVLSYETHAIAFMRIQTKKWNQTSCCNNHI